MCGMKFELICMYMQHSQQFYGSDYGCDDVAENTYLQLYYQVFLCNCEHKNSQVHFS